MELSVITVSWRDPQGLARTVQSLKTLRDVGIGFEHVVVSDALPPCPSDWPLVPLPEPRRRGIYAAMNHGLKHSSGEALWFLNGGDQLHDPDALSEALQSLWAFDGVWMGARMSEQGRYCYTHRPGDFTASVERGRFPCHQAFVYHRRAFRERAFPELELVGDEAHFVHLWKRRHPIVSRDRVLVDYDCSGRSRHQAELRFQELEKWYRGIREEIPSSAYRRMHRHLRRRRRKARWGNRIRRMPVLSALRPLWWQVLERRGGYA